MSLGIPHLVREKSHHSRLCISAHRGTLCCIEVQPQGYGLAPRVFTAGEDGALRIWEGRGLSLIVETSSLTRHRISCMCVSGQKVVLKYVFIQMLTGTFRCLWGQVEEKFLLLALMALLSHGFLLIKGNIHYSHYCLH